MIRNWLSKYKKRWWFSLLLLGVILRLLLMPITLHQDLLWHSLVTYFFAYEGKLNIYQHIASLPLHPDIFIYPPLTYFILGFFRLILRPLTNPLFTKILWDFDWIVYPYFGVLKHLFLLKLPYLFLDIGVAFLLSELFSKKEDKRLVFGLWMINPVTLYATFMVGQFDILPVLFTVLAIYFAKKGRDSFSLLSLGIGGSFKMYPLFLVPVSAFVMGKSFKERIKYLLLGFLPFIVTTLPYLPSSAFRQMVLFTPKSQKMLFMSLPVSGAEGIYPFVLILVLIYLFAFYTNKKVSLTYYFLAILLLIFSVTHYHPQWFLWVTPFLIVELVQSKFANALLVLGLFALWFVIVLSFDTSLNIGLFRPILLPDTYLPEVSKVLSAYMDVNQIKSIVRSIFAAISAFYVVRLLCKLPTN